MSDEDTCPGPTHRALLAAVRPVSRPSRIGLLLDGLLGHPVLGPAATAMLRLPLRHPAVTGRVTRTQARLLQHRRRTRIARSWLFAAGQPVLPLSTTGRRTGRERTTTVACFTDAHQLVVAAVNLGHTHDPAWALNLEANPTASVVVGGRRITVLARRARGREAARLWQRWLSLQPSARVLREVAGREIPVFTLTAVDPVSRPRAMVTGGSAGIGAAFVDRLAASGSDVVLVARNEPALRDVAARARASHGIEAEILTADLTDPAQLAVVEARLHDDERPVDLLVNNAGSETEHAAFLDRDHHLLAAEVSLNVQALALLTHCAATAMARRGHGTIVNVSAGTAFYPVPGSAPYAASKAFVNRLTEGLHHELRHHGVRVVAVCPGFTRTGAQQRLGLRTDVVPRRFASDPDDVAHTALRAARSGRVLTHVRRGDAAVTAVARLLPRAMWLPVVAHAQRRLAVRP